MLNCKQVLARLSVAYSNYKSLEGHHVFELRAWNILLVARLDGVLRTVEKLINCFVWQLSHLLKAMTVRENVVFGAPQFLSAASERLLLQTVR